jgi:hypothetical protein
MHPALITLAVAARRQDQIAQATQARRARAARRARRGAVRLGSGAAPRRPQPCADLVVRQA